MGSRIARIEVRLDGIQRAILQFGFAGIATMVIGFLGIITARHL